MSFAHKAGLAAVAVALVASLSLAGCNLTGPCEPAEEQRFMTTTTDSLGVERAVVVGHDPLLRWAGKCEYQYSLPYYPWLNFGIPAWVEIYECGC